MRERERERERERDADGALHLTSREQQHLLDAAVGLALSDVAILRAQMDARVTVCPPEPLHVHLAHLMALDERVADSVKEEHGDLALLGVGPRVPQCRVRELAFFFLDQLGFVADASLDGLTPPLNVVVGPLSRDHHGRQVQNRPLHMRGLQAAPGSRHLGLNTGRGRRGRAGPALCLVARLRSRVAWRGL